MMTAKADVIHELTTSEKQRHPSKYTKRQNLTDIFYKLTFDIRKKIRTIKILHNITEKFCGRLTVGNKQCSFNKIYH